MKLSVKVLPMKFLDIISIFISYYLWELCYLFPFTFYLVSVVGFVIEILKQMPTKYFDKINKGFELSDRYVEIISFRMEDRPNLKINFWIFLVCLSIKLLKCQNQNLILNIYFALFNTMTIRQKIIVNQKENTTNLIE